MSLPESSSDEPRGVLVRRQKTTIYTVLLLIAAAGAGDQLPGDGVGMGAVRLSIQAAGELAFGRERRAV